MESTTPLDATHLKYGTRWLFRSFIHKKPKNGFILCNFDVYASSKHAENIEKDHFTPNNCKPHQAESILRQKSPLVGYCNNKNYELYSKSFATQKFTRIGHIQAKLTVRLQTSSG